MKDPEEVDSWYDEQKEMLTEQYTKKLEEGKKPGDVEKEFHRSFEKLRTKYHQQMEKAMIAKKKREEWDKKVKKAKQRVKELVKRH